MNTHATSAVSDIKMEVEEPVFEELSSHHKIAIAAVYHNDYLMEKIISNLPTIQDRLTLDRVSVRFQQLVREAKWENLKPSFEKLEIFAPGGRTSVGIILGTFRKFIKSKDFAQELMTILWKLLLFKRHVKRVVYDGSYANGKMGLTRELLEHLNNFTHLKNLVLKFSKTEQAAIDYLASDECHFKHRIESLTISEMQYGPWISHLLNKKLRTLSIRIQDFSIAEALVERMDQLDLHLETINIEVTAFSRGLGVDVLTGLSNRCANFNITFSTNLHLAQNLDLWTNIRSLSMNTESIEYLYELPVVFKSLKHLEQLEHLTISERINKAGFDSLRKGIQGLTKLKCLKITDHAPTKEFGIIEPFFEALPLSLEDIELNNFIWEARSITKFSERSFRNLKKLTVRQPHKFGRQGSHLFERLITRFRSLEKFHFFDNIDNEKVNHVIDHPNLNDVRISVWGDITMEMVTALRRKFNTYRCFGRPETIELQLRQG